MFLLSASAIVFVGNFNPAIFQPQWFDRYKILPIQDIQWAEGQKPKRTEIDKGQGRKMIIDEVPNMIITPERADINFPSERIQVDARKFICSTNKRKYFSLIKETTVKIFSFLEHTPVQQLGINFDAHWKFKNSSQSVLRNIFASDSKRISEAIGNNYLVGGTIKIDKNDSIIKMKFDSSSVLEDGIYINANFHREIQTKQAGEAVDVLNKNYEADRTNFIEYAQKLLGDPIDTWERQ